MENVTSYQTVLIQNSLKDRYIKRCEKALKEGRILKLGFIGAEGFYILHRRPSGILEQIEYLFK